MYGVSRVHSTDRSQFRKPGRIFASIVALPSLLWVCALVTPSVAQPASSQDPASGRSDARQLVLKLDRLFAEKRHDEARAVREQLTASRTDAIAAGLELLSSQVVSSQLTVVSLCDLASDEVPLEATTAVLAAVLPSSSMSDWTKMHCLGKLRRRVDVSFRGLLVQFAIDPGRDANLRIAALRVAATNWTIESRATLLALLQTAQEPVLHHKAMQYLSGAGRIDDLQSIEQFVLNRDPATAGSTLNKEYGLLILRRHLGEGVLPLLASILRDESWPAEIQERAIDLLARPDLPGGRSVLDDVRARASSGLRVRIDAALAGRE